MIKNTQLKILIVEDEFISSQFIQRVLENLGYHHIFTASNANDALLISNKHDIDFCFMDINIEGNIDGLECAKLLNKSKNIPILYITAYGDSTTIAEATQTNGYGYLIKPFDAKEIEAAFQIALRCVYAHSSSSLGKDNVTLGNGYHFDLTKKSLFIHSSIVKLTKKETEILTLFCSKINENISYILLKQKVWENKSIANSTIRDTILRLRKKAPLLNIDNHFGMGYCLKNT